MFIEDYAKKQLFGSIDKNKLEANLLDYTCELIIEDYLQVDLKITRAAYHHSVVTSNLHPSPPGQNPSPSKLIPSHQSKILFMPIKLLKNKEKLRVNL